MRSKLSHLHAALWVFLVLPLLIIPPARAENLTLRYISHPWGKGCAWGELDVLDYERSEGRKSFRLILEIKAADPNKQFERVVDLSSFNLREEFRGDIDLPAGASYIVRLCSDWVRKDGCERKPFVSPQEYFQGVQAKNKRVKLSHPTQSDETYAQAELMTYPKLSVRSASENIRIADETLVIELAYRQLKKCEK